MMHDELKNKEFFHHDNQTGTGVKMNKQPLPSESILTCPCHRTSTHIAVPSSKEEGASSCLHSSSKVYCQSCIDKILSPSIVKHQAALTKRNETRDWCMEQLIKHRKNHSEMDWAEEDLPLSSATSSSSSSLTSTIESYRDRIQTLNSRLDNLKEQCKDKSVLSASNSVKIQDRVGSLEESKFKVQQMKSCLDNLYQSVLVSSTSEDDDGEQTVNEASTKDEISKTTQRQQQGMMNLSSTIHSHIKQVKNQRFRLALKAFIMHRMDVGDEYNQLTFDELLRLSTTKPTSTASTSSVETTTDNPKNFGGKLDSMSNKRKSSERNRFKRRIHDKQPSGIGKIGDMPIPHAGQELFGVLPQHMLSSSLRLIANLTNLLARCLGIVLPHPILLRPMLVHASDETDKATKSKKFKDTSNYTKKQRYGDKRRSRKKSSDDEVKGDTNGTDETNVDKWIAQESDDIISNVNRYGDQIDTSNLEMGVTTFKDFENLGETVKKINGEDTYNTTQNEIKKSNGPTEKKDSNREITAKSKESFSAVSSSTSSLISLVGSSSNILSRSARRAFVKMKGTTSNSKSHHQNYGSEGTEPKKGGRIDNQIMLVRRMDEKSIKTRLNHASFAIICESSKIIGTTGSNHTKNDTMQNNETNEIVTTSQSQLVQYELRPPRREDLDREKERFTIGLQLLQNDIIALSIQAGVPIETLWPAEAMLLNLHSLRLYCMNQCR